MALDGGSSSDFEISKTSATTGYGYTLSLTQSSGSVGTTTIWVRLKSGKSVDTYVDNITISGGTATAQEVVIGGEVTAGCANTVTVSQSGTNATVSLSSTSVTTCGDAASRQVTVSVAPNTCYAAPTDATVITKTGTAASNVSYVSGPTGSGPYTYLYQIAQDASGTVNFAVSLSTKTTYTVSYAAGSVPSGGGSITGSHANDTKTCGTSMTLPEATFTTTGYTQTGWSKTDGGSQYAAVGGSYTDNAAQTFYPVWTVKSYSVTWMVNNTTYSAGGSASVNHGSHIATLPTAPSPASYCGDVFVGWTTDENYVHNTSPLYTTASGFPTASGAQVFYAVFADYAE